MSRWVIRSAALIALLVVVWCAGPRAWQVVSARLDAGAHHRIDLDRVGLRRLPDWLEHDRVLSRGVFEELASILHDEIGGLDETAATELRDRLQALSWVAAVRLHPRNERFELALELHRPVLEVVPVGAAAGKVAAVYVTVEGICVHKSPTGGVSDLPQCRLLSGPIPGSLPRFILGQEHPDPRVLAAAAVAVEWRDELRPLVSNAPRLVAVDASNLHYRLLGDRSFSEVRIGLQVAAGGDVAWFGYGHPPGQPLPRVTVADKATVLRAVLARHAGLVGVEKGDLRFVNLWEDWLRVR